jgi:hypothetical protein
MTVADKAAVELDGPSHHRTDIGDELVRHTADNLVERRFTAASCRLSYFVVITSPPWRARDMLFLSTIHYPLSTDSRVRHCRVTSLACTMLRMISHVFRRPHSTRPSPHSQRERYGTTTRSSIRTKPRHLMLKCVGAVAPPDICQNQANVGHRPTMFMFLNGNPERREKLASSSKY